MYCLSPVVEAYFRISSKIFRRVALSLSTDLGKSHVLRPKADLTSCPTVTVLTRTYAAYDKRHGIAIVRFISLQVGSPLRFIDCAHT